MGTAPQYYTILVVDIESFGKRRNPVQALLRERLYRILDEAIAAAGIDQAGAPEPVDRGDGAFWLLSASTPKVMLTGPFIAALRAGLEAHKRVSAPEAHMRLRVALHAGEVSRDQHGWVGEDLNTACRLVDLQSLRDALTQAANSLVAVAVSDAWYRSTIRHDYPGIDSASYHPMPFRAKEVNQTAWITVPGFSGPPPQAGETGESAPGGERDETKEGGSPAGRDPAAGSGTAQGGSGTGEVAAPDPAKVTNVGPFAGAVIHAGRVYGGNHYEIGGSQ
jgi:class 3 adenylate cyclase